MSCGEISTDSTVAATCLAYVVMDLERRERIQQCGAVSRNPVTQYLAACMAWEVDLAVN